LLRRALNQLAEALNEAVSLYLSEPGYPVKVELDVTTEQVLVRSA